MICTNCGKEVPDNAKVCGYCGHKLKVVDPLPTAITPKEVPAGKATRTGGVPAWIWVVGGLALTALAFMLFTQFSLWVSRARQNPQSNSAVGVVQPTANEDGQSSSSSAEEPAAEGPTSVSVYSGEAEVPAGSEIELTGGWVATTPELVSEYFDSIEAYVTVDGEPRSIGTPFLAEVQEGDYDGDGNPDYSGYWYIPMSALEAGRHVILVTIFYSYPITDGFDLDGNGEEDIYSEDEFYDLILIAN